MQEESKNDIPEANTVSKPESQPDSVEQSAELKTLENVETNQIEESEKIEETKDIESTEPEAVPSENVVHESIPVENIQTDSNE